MEKLENGVSRDTVLKGFANSKEFANIMAKYGIEGWTIVKTCQVRISPDASDDLDQILGYLKDEFKSQQAVDSVFRDYLETRRTLARTADKKPEPESPRLRERGLKRIDFKRHDYFMLYKIEGNKVIIVDIFHVLQDFENKLR